ncbi:hypothetical protein FA13DRAFT_1629847, partial [Coprinellus micaceus]
LHPSIQEQKDMIENDADMATGFNCMFENATNKKIQNYDNMLSAMNVVLGEAPFYGPPCYMILYEAMNSNGGFTAFLADKLNSQFKKIFNVWAQFLGSPKSAGVLTEKEGGWFLDAAISAMEVGFDGFPFPEIFACDPTKPHWGYTSWDDFFVRTLNPVSVPLNSPSNLPSLTLPASLSSTTSPAT